MSSFPSLFQARTSVEGVLTLTPPLLAFLIHLGKSHKRLEHPSAKDLNEHA